MPCRSSSLLLPHPCYCCPLLTSLPPCPSTQGDFIFYSICLSRAAFSGWAAAFATYLAILAGEQPPSGLMLPRVATGWIWAGTTLAAACSACLPAAPVPARLPHPCSCARPNCLTFGPSPARPPPRPTPHPPPTGLGCTLLWLAVARRALPALPISIALAVACFVLAKAVMEAVVLPASLALVYF